MTTKNRAIDNLLAEWNKGGFMQKQISYEFPMLAHALKELARIDQREKLQAQQEAQHD